MRKSDFIFTAILPPLDFLMLMAAGFLSFGLRQAPWLKSSALVSPIFYSLPPAQYFFITLAVALVWVVIFALSGLYNIHYPRKFFDQALRIFFACSVGLSAIIIFLFFKREILYSSRFIVLSIWLISILLLILERGLIRILKRYLLRLNIGRQTVLVIGRDQNTQNLIKELIAASSWGLKPVAFITNLEGNFLAKIQREFYKNPKIAGIILADLETAKFKINQILNFCYNQHLSFRYAADIFSARLKNIDLDIIAGIPLIEIKKTPLEGWGKLAKRIIDFFLSLILIILLLPIFALIILIIRITSRGPAVIKLSRIGQKGKKFSVYKFRSMINNAHQLKKDLLPYNERKDGPLFKIKNDPRVTKFGRLLRRLSLDELPQLFNVCFGAMSLAGPRPHEPEEVAKYTAEEKRVLTIKPGITGLAQISGRSDLSFREEVRLDMYYIENWSLGLDFGLIFKTPFYAWFLKRKSAV